MHTWKTLKVFVSSTFQDMELERDRLAQVFQAVKDEIAPRRLTLVPYDLRWRDRHEDRDVVRWCLEMLGRCQYFVGILGCRYGWRPPRDEENRENARRISITEMEIEKALALVPRERRFFCFGDSSSFGPADLARETPEDLASIEALKKRLRGMGEAVWDYRDSDELLEIVRSRLQSRIDADYDPASQVPVERHTDEQALREIVEDKTRGFTGREGCLRELDRFARSRGADNYLAVHGVAGTGKSALLASFVSSWQRSEKTPIAAHFMGMSTESRSVDGMARNIGRQLRECGLVGELSDDPEEMRREVRTALESTAQDLILLLDGLDELDESDQSLLWLSRTIPPNVRVVLSTRPGGAWSNLETYRRLRRLELSPLNDSEMEKIIAACSKEHDLRLSEIDREELKKRAAGNPLFLRVAMDEVASGGTAVGQLATNIEALFRQILERLQKRHGREAMDDYLGFIAAARSGIAEHELRELLDPVGPRRLDARSAGVNETVRKWFDIIESLQKEQGEDLVGDYLGFLAASRAGLPQDELRGLLASDRRSRLGDEFFLRVRKALDNFVVERGGLLVFFHPEFEKSIQMALGKAAMRGFHRRFADYLRDKGYRYARTLSELPYQEQWGERMESLLSLLSDIDFLDAKCAEGMIDGLCEDFRRALKDKVVALPHGIRIEAAPGIGVRRESIRLLERAASTEIQFLRRHPSLLVQTLWNRCYWHDCPRAEEHYVGLDESATYPWQRSYDQIHLLVDMWRNRRIQTGGFVHWKSRRPLLPDLNSALLRTFKGHQAEVNSAAFSPNGALIASASKDHSIRVWDVMTGECVHTFSGHEKSVGEAVFSPDGRLIASASGDGEVRLWDVTSGERIDTLKANSAPLLCLAFNGDGTTLACGGEDKTVRVWNLQDRSSKALVGHRGAITRVRFSPDGVHLASGSEDGTVQLWDMAHEIATQDFSGHEHWVCDVAFNPEGSLLASASEDQTVRVWETANGKCVKILKREGKQPLSVAFSPDGLHLAVGSADRTISIWSLVSGQCLRALSGHEKSVYRVEYGRDGETLASASGDGTVRVWETGEREHLPLLQSHVDRVTSTRTSADGRFVGSTSYDGTARIWDSASGRCVSVLAGHRDIVQAICFSSDSARAATGSFDNDIRVWDMADGKCVLVLSGHGHAVLDVAFSPDDRALFSASYDRTVRRWNLSSGQCEAVFKGHKRDVTCVAVDRSGGKILSGSGDNTVRLWDRDGNCLQTWEGPGRKVCEVGFAADGARIFCISEDDQVRLWSAADGACLETKPRPESNFSDIPWRVVRRDNLELASLDKEGRLQPPFFPGVPETFDISRQGLLHGGDRTGYVYILERCEGA